jgi:L-ribulose-5-phosphate 3-epimerase
MNTRREFLKSTGTAVALAALEPAAFADPSPSQPQRKRPIGKAIMYGTVGVPGSVGQKVRAIKDAGFEGFEAMSHMDQDEVLRARDENQLHIPSVCCSTHWKENLASPDPAMRARGLDGLRQALRDAKAYGATSVLFVPAVVNKEVSYADAYRRSQEELRKVLPLAQELNVKIAIENVWNNFHLSPLEAARYIDEFNSPAIGWHFDVGNSLRNGWPEQWIRILGPRIQKLHIKEFSRKKMEEHGPRAGFNVEFLEGDNDWPTVMQALDEIPYRGWSMAEQGGGDTPEGLKNLSDRMEKILAA